MNRIRVLESENEELARQRESGRPARLNCLIALRQDFIGRVKKTNEKGRQLEIACGSCWQTMHKAPSVPITPVLIFRPR
ncbi:unnamed protein product [Dibothriocephalus latus]|uniref:Uncharacterized protein n=1 Tax=Dibothriocephalus latus TaxID=60516 RepID=A0A3P7R450_DIBLA|nr:unnamed protein product [Dibothriocephalus latus]